MAFCRKTEKSAKMLSLTLRNRILILEVGLKLKSAGRERPFYQLLSLKEQRNQEPSFQLHNVKQQLPMFKNVTKLQFLSNLAFLTKLLKIEAFL